MGKGLIGGDNDGDLFWGHYITVDCSADGNILANIQTESWPAYDKKITPTNTMGVVAEAFRQWTGTHRSDHPARSVAAWGSTLRAYSF